MMNIVRYCFALSLLVLANSAFAAIHCVDTATEIQTALNTAASNSQNDEVRIVQGTYVGNFVYATATEAYDLAVSGGWASGCASQVINSANTILDGNQAGTVLALSADGLSVNLYVKGLTLRNGKGTSGRDGGLYASVGEGGTVSLEANTVESNTSNGGSGVHVFNGSVTFTNNTIEGNTSGGVSVNGYLATTTFTNNTIKGNTGVGVSVRPNTGSPGPATFTNNTIEGNTVGGVYVFGGTVTFTFTNNTIEGNTASSGGGVYVDYSQNVTFSNNTIEGNTSSSYGGGVFVKYSGTVTFINNTIEGNSSSYGGGLALRLESNEERLGNYLYNNLFWDNTSGNASDLWIENDLDYDYVATPIGLFANNFDQSEAGFQSTLPITINPSNLNKVDPLFADPAKGDFHLLPGSPMINAGYLATPNLPDFDIEGNPRVLGASVDIGAYEYDDGSDPKAILTVTKYGNGTGTVISNPTGINCGSDCNQAYDFDTPITLTATPADANSTFAGWSGADDCTDGQVTMDTNKTCTATFNAQRQLTITKTGEGGGTVTSSPVGIDCGASCNALFLLNQQVTLTATPSSGASFTGWSGACSGADICRVTMDAAKTVTASFTSNTTTHPITITLNPPSGGSVSCEPNPVPSGGSSQCWATPASGHAFVNWSGHCAGIGPTCTLSNVTAARSITANFLAIPAIDATHSAPGYWPNGAFTVTSQFNDASGNTPLSLVWRPLLPSGWTITSVSGEGAPELSEDGTQILFTGTLSNMPIDFSYQVGAPAAAEGEQYISVAAEYQNDTMANPVTFAAMPNPLVLPMQQTSYHSADYQDARWQIDSTEASRVLAYWRADDYHIDLAGIDGYAQGSGSTDGPRHSADYHEPYWRIDSSEANRVLAYWRATAYHVDLEGFDGYAPGPLAQISASALTAAIRGDAQYPYGMEESSPSKSLTAADVSVVTPSHSAPGYVPGGTLTITNTVQRPADKTLLSLLWRPTLPTGWIITSVSGDGAPELSHSGTEILFTGSLVSNPLVFTYQVQVPASAQGQYPLSAQMEYQIPGSTNPQSVAVEPNPFYLTPGSTSNTLYVTATGGGTVTSSPMGINCGTVCDADFDSAQDVTLTSTPNAGLTFNGWLGACTGTGTCQIPMSNDQGVMAAFGTVQPSHVVLVQQDQLGGTSHYVAPRMVVLGPALTVAAGSDLTVEAGEQIKFLPGFRVEHGATFRTRINPTLRP